MVSDLWNCCKIGRQKQRKFFFLKLCLNKDLKKFLKKLSGRSNVFIISKFQSSLSNKFYDRSQTLQTEAIFIVFRIYWPDWLALYQFFIVISYICD